MDESGSGEIPASTLVYSIKNKIEQNNIAKNTSQRVTKLSAYHLLDPQLVKVHDKSNKCFIINDTTFRSIMIKGTIVGMQFQQFKTKNRTLISVHDSTAIIDCYVEANDFLEETRLKVEEETQEMIAKFKKYETNDPVSKAAFMMLQSAKIKLNKLPSFTNFKLQDRVKIVGTPNEYEGKRYCFVTSIIKDEGFCNAEYEQEIEELYEKMYI